MTELLKKTIMAVLFLSWFAGSAQAMIYTFQSTDGQGNAADMMDLDHHYYYGWSISNDDATNLANQLESGWFITSATLTYKNIWNWQHEENDLLYTFLLSSPPPKSGAETVPVSINGVARGHYVYTYTKTATTPKGPYSAPQQTLLNQGYTETISNGRYYYKKTTTYTATKISSTCLANTTPTPPIVSSYKLDASKTTFKQDTVTLQAGIPLSGNLWERYDNQSAADVNWGLNVESTLIWDDPDKTPPNANPWHDTVGGHARNLDLTYNFDADLIGILTGYAADGSFGFGIDPDCHYYNEGITLTIQTAFVPHDEPPPVPEPTTVMLLGVGLFGLGLAGKKKFIRK